MIFIWIAVLSIVTFLGISSQRQSGTNQDVNQQVDSKEKK